MSSRSFGSSYFSVKGGYAVPDKIYDETRYDFARFDFGNGTNISVAAGKKYELVALELELSHRELESEELYNGAVGVDPMSGHAAQTGLLLNGYYGFYTGNNFTSAISIGIGKTKIEWNNVASPTFTPINDNNEVTTYKVGIIIGLHFNNTCSMLLEYSRLYLDDLTIKDGNGATGTLNNQDVNVFTVGLKYTFM